MARFNQGKGKKDEQLFFTDSLNETDKKKLNSEFQKPDNNVETTLGSLLDAGLSIKISWSDYNDSYSVSVTPRDRDHPSHGTFYSGFHSNWGKAVFIVFYLLNDRYDMGDWTRGGGKRFDNDW